MRPHLFASGAGPFPRAIGSVRAGTGDLDPVAVLSELNSAFSDWKTKHAGEIDDLSIQLAALRLNGPPAAAAGRPSAQARAAFGSFIKTGSTAALDGLPRSAMTIGSDPDGGYFVPDELSTEIISLQRTIVAMRNVARVMPIVGASYKQPINLHGSGSGWVGESEGRPPLPGVKLAIVEFTPHELYANPGVSQSLLDDSAINLSDFLSSEISDEFSAQEGAAFISGDGIKKPRGLLTYRTTADSDAARPFGTFQYVPGGDAGDLPSTSADQLRTLVFTLKAKYRANATWMMNSLTMSIVSTWKDGTGRNLWMPALSLGLPSTLLGYPVEIDEGMPDVAANALSIAFGDFQRGYMIVDRIGIRILRDAFTNKPNVQFYTTKRVDGGALDTTAIKFLKISAA